MAGRFLLFHIMVEYMTYRTPHAPLLSPEDLLDKLYKGALLYSEYADTTLLFIFRKNKSEPYHYYEVRFGKNNFMHLAGIKSKTLHAADFYEACLTRTITAKDCTPRKDKSTMYSKTAILEHVLDLRSSKLYHIGKKDLITRDNDFEMATGNAIGVMGYDSRINIKGTNRTDKTKPSIPTTLLNNSISYYCSSPQKIIFILQRSDKESRYCKLFYEIKKDLFQTKKSLLPTELRDLISI